MQFCRRDQVAIIKPWPEVQVGKTCNLREMSDFCNAYDSRLRWTTGVSHSTWYFEDVQAAIFFKLKFG